MGTGGGFPKAYSHHAVFRNLPSGHSMKVKYLSSSQNL